MFDIIAINYSCHQCGNPIALCIDGYSTVAYIREKISKMYKIPIQDIVLMVDGTPIDDLYYYADTKKALNVLCTKNHDLDINACVLKHPPVPPISFMEHKGCGFRGFRTHDLNSFYIKMNSVNELKIHNDVKTIIKRLFMTISLWYTFSVMEYAYDVVMNYTRPLNPKLKPRGIKERAVKMGLHKNTSFAKISEEIKRVECLYNRSNDSPFC